MTVSRLIILRMRNVTNIRCRETQNIHFMFSNLFSENYAVYEVSKNVVETETADVNMVARCMLD